MRILEYAGLDTSRVEGAYRKIVASIAAGDFRAAQVKKLANLAHGRFYRARLGDADRLLFSLVRHGDEVCALMLEVIRNHDYDRSRFLRGAAVDEARIPDFDAGEAAEDALPLRYLHPERGVVHLLDKPISFDDAQEAVYRMPPPLVVVGSAGSGKTALTLEKLKHAEGEVLYVTQSAYLAANARDLYYANGFEHAGQEAAFLSYREFVESIHVPPGREAHWRDFAAWFSRMRQAFRDLDAHQAFEEIRGVIGAAHGGVLSRDAPGRSRSAVARKPSRRNGVRPRRGERRSNGSAGRSRSAGGVERGGSVIVVFELVAHGCDDHVGRTLDLEESDVAGFPERDGERSRLFRTAESSKRAIQPAIDDDGRMLRIIEGCIRRHASHAAIHRTGALRRIAQPPCRFGVPVDRC